MAQSEKGGKRRVSGSGVANDQHTDSTMGQTSTMTETSDRTAPATALEQAPPLNAELQGHLGRQLRAVYSELVHEPMPDRFSKLLNELAAAQSKHPSKKPEQE